MNRNRFTAARRVLTEDPPGLEDLISSPPLDARGRVSWGGTFQHGVGPQQSRDTGRTLEELEVPGHTGFWKRAERMWPATLMLSVLSPGGFEDSSQLGLRVSIIIMID